MFVPLGSRLPDDPGWTDKIESLKQRNDLELLVNFTKDSGLRRPVPAHSALEPLLRQGLGWNEGRNFQKQAPPPIFPTPTPNKQTNKNSYWKTKGKQILNHYPASFPNPLTHS